MEGIRGKVVGEDGVSIGLLTAGSGPALLLVHGGMGRLESWAPVWSKLAEHRQVTAMDRRGRGTSGDTVAYSLSKEFADIVAVATHIAARQSAPVDVFAHSFGATCTLGAAARGAPFRRLALYEPPGPQTVPAEWVERVCALVAEGKSGRAMFSFVTEIVGLSPEQFEGYRNLPGAEGVLAIVAATMPREARALTSVDLGELAEAVAVPVLLLLGATSPGWAAQITRALEAALADPQVAVLAGQGHDALDSAPDLVVEELVRFFDSPGSPLAGS
ncbi:MAG: alpha/beta hydrolase [Acidimicrobiales bacterium]